MVYKDTTQEYNAVVAVDDYDLTEPLTICLVVKFADESFADYYSVDGQLKVYSLFPLELHGVGDFISPYDQVSASGWPKDIVVFQV
mgnify:CR=1 FL=1